MSGRYPLCWATGDCERPIYYTRGKWHCPTHGPLRGPSSWMETFLKFAHTSPAVVERIMEPKGDR